MSGFDLSFEWFVLSRPRSCQCLLRFICGPHGSDHAASIPLAVRSDCESSRSLSLPLVKWLRQIKIVQVVKLEKRSKVAASSGAKIVQHNTVSVALQANQFVFQQQIGGGNTSGCSSGFDCG